MTSLISFKYVFFSRLFPIETQILLPQYQANSEGIAFRNFQKNLPQFDKHESFLIMVK